MADAVLVFDMGGVLYDFQGDRLIAENSRRARRWRSEEVQSRWVPLVLDFETGSCSEAEFASRIVESYDLKLTPTEFLRSFRDAAAGFYPGALDLLAELAERHRLFSLSNSNGIQWPKVVTDLGAQDPFSAHHPSHVSGFHKPDARAFEAVLQACENASARYFFDDRSLNIAAAEALGFRARRVRGVAEARRACVELGLLGR